MNLWGGMVRWLSIVTLYVATTTVSYVLAGGAPPPTVPTGQTEFNFHVASFNFHSDSYDWLVIAGAKAMYKGDGTINGVPGYRFRISAIDGQINGGGGIDKFRIKIWEASGGGVVYDNQMGGGDNDDPTTAIAGGNIKIHKAK